MTSYSQSRLSMGPVGSYVLSDVCFSIRNKSTKKKKKETRVLTFLLAPPIFLATYFKCVAISLPKHQCHIALGF